MVHTQGKEPGLLQKSKSSVVVSPVDRLQEGDCMLCVSRKYLCLTSKGRNILH